MDYETRDERRYALRRIIWDVVLSALALFYAYTLVGDFISADRSNGWTSQSYITLIGSVMFVGVAILLILGLIRKIKRYREEY